MAYYVDSNKRIKKVLAVAQFSGDNIIAGFGYSKVLNNTLVTRLNPIVNVVVDNDVFSFNSTISNNTLSTATASVTNNTLSI